jgi:Sec-independent protein translocase protein TatA
VDLFWLLVVILILAIIWRGPKTLPQIGALLGRGVREARHEAERMRSDSSTDQDATPKT